MADITISPGLSFPGMGVSAELAKALTPITVGIAPEAFSASVIFGQLAKHHDVIDGHLVMLEKIATAMSEKGMTR